MKRQKPVCMDKFKNQSNHYSELLNYNKSSMYQHNLHAKKVCHCEKFKLITQFTFNQSNKLWNNFWEVKHINLDFQICM